MNSVASPKGMLYHEGFVWPPGASWDEAFGESARVGMCGVRGPVDSIRNEANGAIFY